MTPETEHAHLAQRIALYQPTAPTQPSDGRGDFDFFIGSWTIRHRKLKARLKGSTEWEEFGGQSAARKVLGGLGNFDEITMETPGGTTRGMTLRLFDPQARQWSIYWADSAHGTLERPMIGGFEGNRGEFYDQEFFEGRAIFSRFFWTNISPTACRWEQAFSADGGKTWETNWIMEFTRRADGEA